MNAIVIKHVKIEELPEAWRAKLVLDPHADTPSRVTVRIEAEGNEEQVAASLTNDPLFGMWRDREDMADVGIYIRDIRSPRFTDDGVPTKD